MAEQARTILEDITVARLEGRLLGSAETTVARGRVRPTIPTSRWWPTCRPAGWRTRSQPYLDAFRELVLPATEVLVGNHKTLTDFLLPEWDGERPPSARELRRGRRRARHALRAGHRHDGAGKGHRQFIDNVLASPQGRASPAEVRALRRRLRRAPATRCRRRWPRCWPPARRAAGRRSARRCPSSTRAWTRASARHGQRVPDRFFWALPPRDETARAARATKIPPTRAFTDQPRHQAPRRVH